MRPIQPRPDRPRRTSQYLCDLVIREPFGVPQHDNDPLIRGQRRNNAMYMRLSFFAQQIVQGRWRRKSLKELECTAGAPSMIETAIHHQAIEPSFEVRIAAKILNARKQLQEDI